MLLFPNNLPLPQSPLANGYESDMSQVRTFYPPQQTTTRPKNTNKLSSTGNRTLLHPTSIRPPTLQPQPRPHPATPRHRRLSLPTQSPRRRETARHRHWPDRRFRSRLGQNESRWVRGRVWLSGHLCGEPVMLGHKYGREEGADGECAGFEGEEGGC